MLSPDWFSIVWKKFIAGILAISSGLMLGREGPSIQLGAMAGKGIAQYLNASRMEKRVLIASGAAAGLSAAFNAPIAGLLFVVEEIYHHFSRLVWITALVASLVANFVSLNIFGLTPVLALPSELPSLNLNFYWIFLLMGLFLGILGFIYEWVILRFHVIYDYLGKLFHLPSHLYGILAVIFILPIGYYFPQLLGGGNGLIVSLPRSNLSLMMLGLFFLIRFLWSMLSYSSGLPGGIFFTNSSFRIFSRCFFCSRYAVLWYNISSADIFICCSRNGGLFWCNLKSTTNSYDFGYRNGWRFKTINGYWNCNNGILYCHGFIKGRTYL